MIVGAGDLIGAAIARKFPREGYAVCLGRRNGEKSKPLADEIDAGVVTAWVRQMIEEQTGKSAAELPADSLVDPDPIAEAYRHLHRQPRDAWTFELDLRPSAEKW